MSEVVHVDYLDLREAYVTVIEHRPSPLHWLMLLFLALPEGLPGGHGQFYKSALVQLYVGVALLLDASRK